MRRCNDIYEIVTVYYPTSCFTTTKCPTTTTTSSSTSTTTTTTTTQVPSLKLTFDDIANANSLVGDVYNVTDWNTFFDLPTYGNPFTSVEIIGNEVNLIGGSDIKVKPGLMWDYQEEEFLIKIEDTNCITSVGGDAFSYCYGLTDVVLPECKIIYGYPEFNDYGGFGECRNLINLSIPLLEIAGHSSFYYCESLTLLDFPLLVNVGEQCFSLCTNLTLLNLISCNNLGGTIFNNNVFKFNVGQTITLAVPAALMTCNSGLPDGDIQYLQANNTVTIITT